MSETTIEAEVVPPQSQAVAVRQEIGAVDKALPADQIKPPITAAQAKVDAVAALTASAYARAATLELTPEESAKLQADFPDEAFKPGAAGKEHLIYIEHAFLRDRFTEVFNMGKWAMVPRSRWAEPFKTSKGVEGSRVYVEAMLVIRGCFVAESIGEMEYYPSNGSQNYGDAVEGAESASFRRCAKKFGVGLQAWKKDWCEGWWQRKRAGQRQNAPGRAGSPPPPQQTAPPVSRPAPPSQRAPAPVPENHLKAATEETRKWMLDEFKDALQMLEEYFQTIGWLLETEDLKDLALRYVPNTKSKMKALQNMMDLFGRGDKVDKPYESGEIPEPAPAAQAKPAPAKPANVPQGTAAKPKDDEWWRDVIVPVPRKGMKRDEYLKSPDTIGSLYDMRHGSDEESQAARQRLWGFINHYEPKGWTKRDGTEMPASEADHKFREALDALADWHERNHPDEKI